jgi:CubicO group peptidase (beta-lactamase class C family)
VLLITVLSGIAAFAQSADWNSLDPYIRSTMPQWEVPGLAIAVIKNDEIVFQNTYGVKTKGGSEPIDTNTLFAIGSASKAFTAASLGMLVDEGKLKWDDPVNKYLPDFQVQDPYVTREIVVRDLLMHDTGVAPNDFLFWGTKLDRDQIVHRLRYLSQEASLRSRWEYQNLMFITAGQLIPALTGKSWDDFVQERIFGPLGMNATVISNHALPANADIATPHAVIDGKMQPIPLINLDNAGPAGSILSTVGDMARWLRLQMHDGMLDKHTFFSKTVSDEMHHPQMLIRTNPHSALLGLAPQANFTTYGLAWFINDYRGHKIVHHGGQTDGMMLMAGFVPDRKLAWVVMSNSVRFYSTALMYRIIDTDLGQPVQDWSAALWTVQKDAEDTVAQAIREQEEHRVAGTKPSLELSRYVGTYMNPLYGPVEVNLENEVLVVRCKDLGLTADLQHWQYDSFRTVWRDNSPNLRIYYRFATFVLNPQGEVEELRMPVVGNFMRQREPAKTAN